MAQAPTDVPPFEFWRSECWTSFPRSPLGMGANPSQMSVLISDPVFPAPQPDALRRL